MNTGKVQEKKDQYQSVVAGRLVFCLLGEDGVNQDELRNIDDCNTMKQPLFLHSTLIHVRP